MNICIYHIIYKEGILPKMSFTPKKIINKYYHAFYKEKYTFKEKNIDFLCNSIYFTHFL